MEGGKRERERDLDGKAAPVRWGAAGARRRGARRRLPAAPAAESTKRRPPTAGDRCSRSCAPPAHTHTHISSTRTRTRTRTKVHMEAHLELLFVVPRSNTTDRPRLDARPAAARRGGGAGRMAPKRERVRALQVSDQGERLHTNKKRGDRDRATARGAGGSASLPDALPPADRGRLPPWLLSRAGPQVSFLCGYTRGDAEKQRPRAGGGNKATNAHTRARMHMATHTTHMVARR